MLHTVSVRLPEKITEALAMLAKTTDRPKTYIIRKALETYLQEYADYQVAIDRLRDKDDSIISSEELKKRLDL